MRRVVILSGNPLCANPRVVKEADALCAAGIEVEVLGRWIDGDARRMDQELLGGRRWRFRPVVDLSGGGIRAKARDFFGRVISRVCRHPLIRSRWQTHWQLGSFGHGLLGAALRIPGDLYVAHSEMGMWAAVQLLRRRRRVGVDFEDWYSEDLLPEARAERPLGLLKALEATLLREGAHATCTSEAMSDALREAYGGRRAEVIYNAFPWRERHAFDGRLRDREKREGISVHWYSQTLGPGRGLEDLLRAAPLLEPGIEIHLRGRPVAGLERWIEGLAEAGHRGRIFAHELVSPGELPSRIAEHDIGFAGEMNFCRNREVTVTNKVLHYLLCGLAVVASDTPGQLEVAAKAPGAVTIYRSGDPRALAEAIHGLRRSRERLAAAKAEALAAAERTFCWERQADDLVKSVVRAIG